MYKVVVQAQYDQTGVSLMPVGQQQGNLEEFPQILPDSIYPGPINPGPINPGPIYPGPGIYPGPYVPPFNCPQYQCPPQRYCYPRKPTIRYPCPAPIICPPYGCRYSCEGYGGGCDETITPLPYPRPPGPYPGQNCRVCLTNTRRRGPY